jgi:molybdate transport system permease protein
MSLSSSELDAIELTVALATVTTFILLAVGTPLAWWLARQRGNAGALAEALVATPLILPPTVLGFYLLLILAPDTPLGRAWQSLTGEQLAFSFSALVIGSVIYSLPFVVQPLQSAFRRIPAELLQAAATLGASPLDQFRSVVAPLCRRSFITAASLGFAHTVGEFGIILMIGGNIPGETQVLSIALYDQVEALQFGAAHRLAAGLVLFSLALLFLLYRSDRQRPWRLHQ